MNSRPSSEKRPYLVGFIGGTSGLQEAVILPRDRAKFKQVNRGFCALTRMPGIRL
jgi:hypothetical protein